MYGWHGKNIDIQRCSDFSKVCRMARAIVQEKKKEHSRAKIACVSKKISCVTQALLFHFQ